MVRIMRFGRRATIGSCRFIPIVLLAGSVALPAAFAQDAEEEGSDRSQLEVIRVTAQKREQDIMTVPITVTAVGEQLIEDSLSILLSDIDKFIPGFDFSDSSMTQAGISMRGISSPNISIGSDPSSATFYDDMYMPRAAQNVLFSDLQRVEVLKGPQGTLFGRNAAMGVVNIVPKKPAPDREFFIKGTWGTDQLNRYEAMANLPLGDSFYLRANVLSNEQDGIVKNIARPDWNQGTKIWDLGAREHRAGRIAALWDLTDDTSIQLGLDIDDLDQAPPMAVGVSEFAFDGGQDVFASQAENDVRNGVESRDMYGLIGKVNHRFNDRWSVKYVLGLRDWETINREDEDGTGDITRYFDTSNNEDSDILYSELQINFVADRFNVVTGISYSSEDVSQHTELNFTADTVARLTTGELNMMLPPGIALDHIWNAPEWAGLLNALGLADPIMEAIGMAGMPLTDAIVLATGDLTYDIVSQQLGVAEIFGPSFGGMFWQENVFNTGDFENWGIYADVDYAITDRWNLIAGLRYSRDKKDFTWFIPQNDFAALRPGVSNLVFPVLDLAASDSWDKVTGRLVTNYQIDANQMLFASYSTGYKSGGFDSLVPINQAAGQEAFAPEDSTNFEVGYKATLWGKVVANISAYSTELDNFQISVESKSPGNTQAIPTIINENRTIEGVELDIGWFIIDQLLVRVVSEIRQTDIETPAFYNALGELIPARSRSFDADTNYTLIANWTQDTDWGRFNFHVDYVFVENTRDQEPNLEPFKLALPEYFTDRKDLGLRLSWISPKQYVQIGLWGRNLLDERYVESVGGRTAAVLGTPFARINRGREVGVDLKVNF